MIPFSAKGYSSLRVKRVVKIKTATNTGIPFSFS